MQESEILTKIVKENAEIFSDFLHSSFNKCIKYRVFPSCLKKADITPIYKKGSKNCKDNYRSVSILPNISKII